MFLSYYTHVVCRASMLSMVSQIQFITSSCAGILRDEIGAEMWTISAEMWTLTCALLFIVCAKWMSNLLIKCKIIK